MINRDGVLQNELQENQSDHHGFPPGQQRKNSHDDERRGSNDLLFSNKQIKKIFFFRLIKYFHFLFKKKRYLFENIVLISELSSVGRAVGCNGY